jgi:hypothetical protein
MKNRTVNFIVGAYATIVIMSIMAFEAFGR